MPQIVHKFSIELVQHKMTFLARETRDSDDLLKIK